MMRQVCHWYYLFFGQVNILAPVVRKLDNFIHLIRYLIQHNQHIPFNAFGEILHRPMIHALLPSFCITFVWLFRVLPAYFIDLIAAYPWITLSTLWTTGARAKLTLKVFLTHLSWEMSTKPGIFSVEKGQSELRPPGTSGFQDFVLTLSYGNSF